jgi:hypothetical protein
MAALAAFSMRAMGIPITYDYTIQFSGLNTGHSWNSVSDSAGNHISFMGTQSAPGESHQGTELTKSKTYRQMFARQNPIHTEEANIPPEMRNHQIKDISQEHEGHTDIDIPVRFSATVNTGYAYLATILFNANGPRWNPVAWGQVQSQYIHYDLVGKNILYLPVYYANNQQTPAGYPFYLDSIGNMQFFEPDTASFRQHTFYESGMEDQAKILTGTVYELSYWNGDDWQSLGKQTAKDASVSFRVPDNALLYLQATDRKNDNFPIFSIWNDRQRWLFK